MSSLAILVDEHDNIIGEKNRYELGAGDIIRISSLWVENSKGQVLLAQRSLIKKYDPGLWGVAAAGTLEPGENYESNIYKEAEEEIGLSGESFEPQKKDFWWRPDRTGRFSMWYKAIVDKPAEAFTLQEEEVAHVAWFDREDLKKQLTETPEKFAASASHWLELFL